MTKNRATHTIGAIILAIIIFLLFMYVVAPVVTSLLLFIGNVFGFGPFGSGDAANPGLIQSLFQGAIITYIASMLALEYPNKWLTESNIKAVAVFYGCFSILYFGAFTVWAYQTEGLIPAIMLCIIGAPAPYAAYSAYK